MKVEVKIPHSLNDITIEQWDELVEIPEDADTEYRTRRTISIVYGISGKDYDKIIISDLELLINAVNDILRETSPLIMKFRHRGVDYGLIPNMDNISFGELTDLDTFAQKKETAKFISVLYRPILQKQGDKYNIASYDGERGDRMKGVPASIMVGVSAFFLNLGIELIQAILKSSNQPELQKLMNSSLEKSGDGIHHILRSVMATSEESTK